MLKMRGNDMHLGILKQFTEPNFLIIYRQFTFMIKAVRMTLILGSKGFSKWEVNYHQ